MQRVSLCSSGAPGCWRSRSERGMQALLSVAVFISVVMFLYISSYIVTTAFRQREKRYISAVDVLVRRLTY
jgi:hypothetical protein